MKLIRKMVRGINGITDAPEATGFISTCIACLILMWVSVFADRLIPDIIGFAEVIYFLTNVFIIILFSAMAGVWAHSVCKENKEE